MKISENKSYHLRESLSSKKTKKKTQTIHNNSNKKITKVILNPIQPVFLNGFLQVLCLFLSQKSVSKHEPSSL